MTRTARSMHRASPAKDSWRAWTKRRSASCRPGFTWWAQPPADVAQARQAGAHERVPVTVARYKRFLELISGGLRRMGSPLPDHWADARSIVTALARAVTAGLKTRVLDKSVIELECPCKDSDQLRRVCPARFPLIFPTGKPVSFTADGLRLCFFRQRMF